MKKVNSFPQLIHMLHKAIDTYNYYRFVCGLTVYYFMSTDAFMLALFVRLKSGSRYNKLISKNNFKLSKSF